MSTGKISQYPDGGAVQPTDLFIVARAGNNYSIQGANVGGSGGGTTIIVESPDSVEDPLIIPGPQGLQGTAGTPGANGTIGRDGLSIYVEPELPEDPLIIPGPRGAAGTNGAGGGAAGTTTITFGSRETSATTTITGQATILSGSVVNAFLAPALTTDNQPDNHWFDSFVVTAGNIVPGTGFTIYIKCTQGVAHGIFNVGWTWA